MYSFTIDETTLTEDQFITNYEGAPSSILLEMTEHCDPFYGRLAARILEVLPQDYTDIAWDGSERYWEHDDIEQNGYIYKLFALEDDYGAASDLECVSTDAPCSSANKLCLTFGDEKWKAIPLLTAYSVSSENDDQGEEYGRFLLQAIKDALSMMSLL